MFFATASLISQAYRPITSSQRPSTLLCLWSWTTGSCSVQGAISEPFIAETLPWTYRRGTVGKTSSISSNDMWSDAMNLMLTVIFLCHGGTFRNNSEVVDLIEHNTITWVKHVANRPPIVTTTNQIILWRWDRKKKRHVVANCRAGEKFKHTEIDVAGRRLIIGIFEWDYDPEAKESFRSHQNVEFRFKHYRRTFSVNYDVERDDQKHTKRWKRKPYY